MKYSLNFQNYQDFSVIHKNKLAERSYFIPYPDRAMADSVSPERKRYESSLVTCLNGEWDFCFYPVPAEIPEMLDTDAVQWEKLPVPSCWQFQGYDRPFYLNSRYQFDFKPPKIPTTEPVNKVFSWFYLTDDGMRLFQTVRPKEPEYNFVGVYRRFLFIEDLNQKYILSFLGVASCMDLYMNGQFVGYSESSFNTSEFDITKFLHEGENECLVVVHRWCNGTYLECQDMFRNNGIFRDVLLYAMDETSVWDVETKTEKEGNTYRLELSAEVPDGTKVAFTLSGHGLERTAEAVAKNGTAHVTFDGLSVLEWTAETPNLYDVYIETKSRCVKLRRGFKKVEIKGNVFLINGQRVKLRGVNHHDSNPKSGYTMMTEDFLKDVKLCKEYNVNTVRTSHYPPDPFFLELCDLYGIYVVDEANLETHGAFSQTFPPDFGRITEDARWEAHYLDRAAHLYARDKNVTAVIMWSLGNESGGQRNTDKMYEYLKKRTDIPIHYESVIHSKRKAYDVASEMYPTLAHLEEIGKGTCKTAELCDRPYFMCEYAHAMGVGPGGIDDYLKKIYAYENLMGGCIWEMCDHAVLHEDGSYTYGGDHGEWIHDKNFCADGLFYPDRTPSTGARMMRFAYRPLIVRHVEKDVLEIFNVLSFTNGSAYELHIQADDGEVFVITPEVKPLETVRVKVPQIKGVRFVHIMTVEKVTGRVVALEQLELHAPKLPVRSVLPLKEKAVTDDGTFRWEKNGVSLMQGAPYTILFRAATDNDNAMDPRGGPKYDFSKAVEKIVGVKQENGKTIVNSILTVKGCICEVEDVYEGTDSGIAVTSRFHCKKGKGELQRFGKTYMLPAAFDKVEYLGRNAESYPDMKNYAPIERVSCGVRDMTEPNIRPQESGNRMDTEFAALTDGKHTVRFTAAGKPFSLSVKPYSDLELMKMKHREDEKVTGTYVTIQAFQKGIGTGACGPTTEKEYLYSIQEDYELKFYIDME